MLGQALLLGCSHNSLVHLSLSYFSAISRLYEKEDLPDGLVILGDSACAFNPAYGQGMTVGILQAKALGAAVSQALGAETSSAAGGNVVARRAALSGVSQKQMRQLGDVLRFPWAVATGTDAPFLPDFKQSAVEAFISGYLDEVRGLEG